MAGPSKSRLGIGMHSYGEHWKAAKAPTEGARFHDPLTFLEYARSMGAGGVQVALGKLEPVHADRFRALTESAGLYLEGQLTVLADAADLARFESEVRSAKSAGVAVLRTALDGRRYETFDTAEAFRQFAARSWDSLTLAEPVLRREGVRLAVENHKDWLVEELVGMLRRLGSEWVGVCVDTGNSIALLEEPMAVVEAYAPYATSTHLKDMGVAPWEDGFLLSEVPLGEGYLDLASIIATLRRARPEVQFNLEMITRDPLQIPCLRERYWATLSEVPARRLAATLTTVRDRASKKPLPAVTGRTVAGRLKFEDDNVRQSLAFAREHLGL